MWIKILITIVVIFGLKISINVRNSDSENSGKPHVESAFPPMLNEILKNDSGNAVINGKHQYAIQQINLNTIDAKELAGKTSAEYEASRYKNLYEKRKIELKRTFDQFVELCKKNAEKNTTHDDRLQKMQKLESDFEKFMEDYAEKNADLYLRSHSYHHYGSLIDMINMRIKHLQIHIEEFN